MRLWLRSLRKEKGFTMAALSKVLNISESYYCSIEGGTRQVKMDMCLAAGISNALGISLKRIAEEEAKLQTHQKVG